MDNSVSVHLFISRKNGNQVSLEETEKLRALFNQICDERGYSLWQVASETAAQQSVQPTGGESAPLQALSTPEVLSIGGADTTPPTIG